MTSTRQLAVLAALALFVTNLAYADYTSSFEPPLYSGSATGVLLAGQDGWYKPSGSAEPKVYTYAGNQYGFAANPQGGEQFVSAKPETYTSVRAQHDIDFTVHDIWAISWDFAARTAEQEPAQDPVGSFSPQPSATARSFIAQIRWVDWLNPPSGVNARFDVYNLFGGGFPDQSPGPEWENLLYNHWYRESVTVDFLTNRITEVTIIDLSTGTSATAYPTEWYLLGGQSPTQPLPTAIRLFTSGNSINNLMGWDNIGVVPEPSVLAGASLGVALLLRRRS